MSNKEVIQAVKINEDYQTLLEFDSDKLYKAINHIQTLYCNPEEVKKAESAINELNKIIYLSMELCAKEMKELSNKP